MITDEDVEAIVAAVKGALPTTEDETHLDPGGQPADADVASADRDRDLVAALDLAAGTAVVAAVVVSLVGRRAVRFAGGVVSLLPGPRPHLPWRPDGGLQSLAHLGREQRQALVRSGSDLLDRLVPAAVQAVLARLDLTATIADHVEIEGLVGTVDIDEVAARVDLDAIAARLDLDAVVTRLDLVSHAEAASPEAEVPVLTGPGSARQVRAEPPPG